ncbi:MAG: DUF4149 domain-containing protein [Acidobacteria bacterium]|nr:DUF4149 domain-containing protein [Acidobacteriota bacterium]
MTLLRYAAFVGLAVWIGGLAVLGGLGAPALFDVLATQDPAGGRELAGLLFGTMLERFQYVAWGAAAVLLVSLGLRAAIGPRPRHTFIRIWVVVAMAGISAVTMFVIIPHVNEIRAAVDGAVAALPAADPRRVEFGRWHALSSGLMLLTVVFGLGLAWAEVHDQH